MIREKTKYVNVWVGLGLFLQIAGFTLRRPELELFLVGNLLVILGLTAFAFGCMHYAEAKGYTGWLGLIGVFHCLGLIILVLLRDKRKEGQ